MNATLSDTTWTTTADDRYAEDVAARPPDAVLVYTFWPSKKKTVTLIYDAREVAMRRMIRSINES